MKIAPILFVLFVLSHFEAKSGFQNGIFRILFLIYHIWFYDLLQSIGDNLNYGCFYFVGGNSQFYLSRLITRPDDNHWPSVEERRVLRLEAVHIIRRRCSRGNDMPSITGVNNRSTMKYFKVILCQFRHNRVNLPQRKILINYCLWGFFSGPSWAWTKDLQIMSLLL